MLSVYVDAIIQHVDESVEDLEILCALLQERSWTRIERKGAERLLQILVEACIGIAKHWLKQENKLLPANAYAVFETLTELQLIPQESTEEWRRIIGMRNAIVHDYLNLDEKVIRAIVINKMYLKLQAFVLETGKQLKSRA